jgi:glucose-6-phosphate-specific signal transduction histidine kinase
MDRGFKIKRLTEENERLKAEVSVKKKLLDKCVDLEDRVKADTVREFAERLKAICWGEIISPSTIDRIAKEILEDEKK